MDTYILAQFGLGGDSIWSFVVWIALMLVFFLFYPRLMISQMMWKLEKTAQELEKMTGKSRAFLLKEISAKPKKDVKSYLVSAGYFLFEPEIFKHISRDMKNLEKDLFPKLAEKGLLYGYPFQGMYLNVNNEQDLRKAKALLV